MMARRHAIIAAASPDYKLVFQNGTIMSSGKWSMDGTKHESWLIHIEPGSVVDTMSGTGHSCYAFLKDNQGITNDSTAHFATGTSLLYLAANTRSVYTAPADAHYLQVRKKVSGTEDGVHPQYIIINGIPVAGLTEPSEEA